MDCLQCSVLTPCPLNRPPPETFRNQPKTTTDRVKSVGSDSILLNQENRRPALDRNGTRGAASMPDLPNPPGIRWNPKDDFRCMPIVLTLSDPDEIILGPPRTNFASATSTRNNRISGEVDKVVKDADRQDRADRFAFRNRATDLDATTPDRYRDRDGRNNFRRRGDQDQDSEGWSTVKPRKSFGTEGAERFHGRMGAAGERFGGREDRRVRDRDEREVGDRRSRNLDGFRDKDVEDAEAPRRNGLARGKSEPWFREPTNEGGNGDTSVSQRERIDKAKSWRDRDPDSNDRRGGERERTNDKNYDRRWDRDREQRIERDPEWLDEPLEEKTHGHTEEDFKKFMETMKAKKAVATPKPEEQPPAALEKPIIDSMADFDLKAASAPAVDSGPDKFFVAFGGGASLEPGTPAAESKEATRSKAQKSSRFMAKFLTPQEDNRARTEPPTPAAAPQAGSSASDFPPQNDTEREAFALLIQKLQRSGGPAVQGSGPAPHPLASLFQQHQPPIQDVQQKHVASPEPFQQYGEHREDHRMRVPPPQHPIHNMISPRQMAPPTQAPPVSRPEQALQDLLAQRHNLPSQGSNRGSQNNTHTASNTEFLMRLMQSHRDVGEPPRPEMQVRMPQPTKQVSLANIPDREPEYQRERNVVQRQQQQQQQQMRLQQQAPPGFLDEQFHSPPEMDSRPQPTQILQRPHPPGLDHHGMHPFQMGGGGAGGPGGNQMPPPPQRPMIPPPGLVNGPRNPNMPNLPGMYPNSFPPPGPVFGAPPPQLEGLSGVPPGALPRMLPPPGFYGGVPPGFLPPAPPGMSPGGYQGGPDGPGGFPGVPFDRRGMMPPGGYRGP